MMWPTPSSATADRSPPPTRAQLRLPCTYFDASAQWRRATAPSAGRRSVLRASKLVMAAAVVPGSLLVMTACTQRTPPASPQGPPPASRPAAEGRHPTADATVDEARPSRNYGLKPTLVVHDDHKDR